MKDDKGEFTYLPDFLIEDRDLIEIKGWLGPNSRRKLKAIVDNHLPVKILFEEQLKHYEANGDLPAYP